MTSLTLVRRVKARPSVVFDAVTTAEGIARWWGPDTGPVLIAEVDPRKGGRYRVRFRKLDGTEHESSGEFLDVVPPERVVMSWRWKGGEEDPNESRVEIVLRAIPEGLLGGINLRLISLLTVRGVQLRRFARAES